MQQQEIEPAILISRHVHSDTVAPKLEVHPGVFHVPYPIQAEPGVSLAEKHRTHGDASCLSAPRSGRVRVWKVELSHVVHQSSSGE